jgi:hypothetical protein
MEKRQVIEDDEDDFLALPEKSKDTLQKELRMELVSRIGRPLKFPDPQEIIDRANEYFQRSIEAESKITITGLALYIGFVSRKQMIEYERRPEYRNAISRAKQTVAEYYENLATTPGMSPQGAIFLLKNLDFTDGQSLELTGPGGGPIQNQMVEGMSDIEKANRLMTFFKNQQQLPEPEEGESDDWDQ